jgi:hypothetical protein
MIIEPKTELERALYSAIIVLLNHREQATITPDRFLTLCRAVPDYALRTIQHNRTDLTYFRGQARSYIAETVILAEWELTGPSAFIEEHHLRAETEYIAFIERRLKSHPDEFSPADLEALIRHFRREELPIRQAALDSLANYVTKLADRLEADPPGMSDDLESLKRSIRSYGFGDELNEALEKIDAELQKSTDAFDQAATMKHIRSFFEQLHLCIAKELMARKPAASDGTPLHQCGNAIDYLERKHVITSKVKDLGRCLYGILSDRDYGVHALKAKRDYTRMSRNMIVEYAVMLFFELDRRLASPGDS